MNALLASFFFKTWSPSLCIMLLKSKVKDDNTMLFFGLKNVGDMAIASPSRGSKMASACM